MLLESAGCCKLCQSLQQLMISKHVVQFFTAVDTTTCSVLGRTPGACLTVTLGIQDCDVWLYGSVSYERCIDYRP
jgi:hypothetical protein